MCVKLRTRLAGVECDRSKNRSATGREENGNEAGAKIFTQMMIVMMMMGVERQKEAFMQSMITDNQIYPSPRKGNDKAWHGQGTREDGRENKAESK